MPDLQAPAQVFLDSGRQAFGFLASDFGYAEVSDRPPYQLVYESPAMRIRVAGERVGFGLGVYLEPRTGPQAALNVFPLWAVLDVRAPLLAEEIEECARSLETRMQSSARALREHAADLLSGTAETAGPILALVAWQHARLLAEDAAGRAGARLAQASEAALEAWLDKRFARVVELLSPFVAQLEGRDAKLLKRARQRIARGEGQRSWRARWQGLLAGPPQATPELPPQVVRIERGRLCLRGAGPALTGELGDAGYEIGAEEPYVTVAFDPEPAALSQNFLALRLLLLLAELGVAFSAEAKDSESPSDSLAELRAQGGFPRANLACSWEGDAWKLWEENRISD